MVALVASASRSLPIERPQNPNGPARLSRIKITRQHSANRRTYFFNSIALGPAAGCLHLPEW
jgi:hypothetical protein